VIRLEARDDFPERLRAERPDIVFNIAEGLRGPNREAHVPAICEFYGVPTRERSRSPSRSVSTRRAPRRSSGPTAFRRPTGRSRATSGDVERIVARGWSYPLFAKPVHEGSSKGITERNLAADADALRAIVADLLERYDQPVLVETFLPGAEFTCGVLGNGRARGCFPSSE
jgi:D-alanine-D-alanine ligase